MPNEILTSDDFER